MTTHHFRDQSAAVLTGTPEYDAIYGTAEADTIHGGDGNDYINGQESDDLLYGDGGDDTLAGGSQNDTLHGGDGNDRLDGDAGFNKLYGEGGNDELSSYNYLGLYGSSLLDGGDGDDVFRSYAGDTVVGGSGADTFNFTFTDAPGLAPTIVDGGAGNDVFNLPNSDDTLEIHGGTGSDIYSLGTAGSVGMVDIFDFTPGAGGDVLAVFSIDFGYGWELQNPFGETGFLRAVEDNGDLLIQLDRDGAAGSEFELRTVMRLHDVRIDQITTDNLTHGLNIHGSTAGAVINGTEGADTLTGELADDTITGLGGNDYIKGEGGNDHIDGGNGDDTLEGGTGNDRIIGGAGADHLAAREGNDILDGGIGNDSLYSDGPGTHLVLGGEGDDDLSGGEGWVTLDGGIGNDRIRYTSNHRDEATSPTARIVGGDGNDQINLLFYSATAAVVADGGDGNDQFIMELFTTKASVIATGGAGSDVYTVHPAAGVYTITDFTTGVGGDQLNVGRFVPPEDGTVLVNPFAEPPMLKLVQRGADTVLQFSPDRGVSAAYRDMVILQNTRADAFTKDNFVDGISPDGSREGVYRFGTNAGERLEGAGLDDKIDGFGGNDEMWGHGGRDRMYGGDGDDFMVGGAGNDTLDGGNGNDQIEDAGGKDVAYGGAGNDSIQLRADAGSTSTMYGGDGNDTLRGGLGNEIFHGGAGDDELRGSSGVDIAMFDQQRAMYTAGRVNGVYQVTDKAGIDGTDILFEIERVYFADGALALDVNGLAGRVYRLYQAAFNRTPDLEGVGFWIGMGDRGVDMTTMAHSFMSSPEFASLYGAAPTNEALVRLFYVNALHRQPDEAGVAFWTNVLDTGKATAEQVLYGFSESDENIAAVAPVIANGFAYDPWL